MRRRKATSTEKPFGPRTKPKAKAEPSLTAVFAPAPLQNEFVGEDYGLHDYIETTRATSMPEAWKVKIYRDYVRGRQRVVLTDKQKTLLGASLGHRFVDNLCQKALSVLTSRLRLARFVVDSPDEATATAGNAALASDMVIQNLVALNTKVVWSMLRDGDTYLSIMWKTRPTTENPNAGYASFARELCFNGETGCFLAYDQENSAAWFVKDWRTRDGSLRRDLYYPDRIYRWVKYSQSGKAPIGPRGWVRYSEPTDPLIEVRTPDNVTAVEFAWPVPWLDPDGNPLGIPFLHFANPHIPNDGAANENDADVEYIPPTLTNVSASDFDPRYGVSIFATGLLGIQDQVTVTFYDLAIGRRFTAAQMYWSREDGSNLDDDEEEEESRMAAPGAWHELYGDKAEAGVLPAGDLSPIIACIDALLASFSRNSEIPVHAFTGVWPSGVAMYQSEMGLHFKVEMIADGIGSVWGHAGYWAMRYRTLYGGESLPLDVPVGMEFDNVSRLDPLTLAEAAKAVSPFVSRREVMRRLGFTETQIERIEAELADEQAASLAHEQSLADAALTRFNAGQGNTNPPGNQPPTGEA